MELSKSDMQLVDLVEEPLPLYSGSVGNLVSPFTCLQRQSVCIGLIIALLGCPRCDIPEAQFHRISKILNNSAASASADTSVHTIGLWHITVNAASNMGNLI